MHADPRIAWERLDRAAQRLAQRHAACRRRLVRRIVGVEEHRHDRHAVRQIEAMHERIGMPLALAVAPARASPTDRTRPAATTRSDGAPAPRRTDSRTRRSPSGTAAGRGSSRHNRCRSPACCRGGTAPPGRRPPRSAHPAAPPPHRRAAAPSPPSPRRAGASGARARCAPAHPPARAPAASS